MAEKKPNQNSNKLSFKDFYTAEYRPGEDESINYRAYRRKRTDEAWNNKGRGPTGIAYSKANPIHMKEIGKLIKHDKFKGNTSGLINHVKKKYPELHDHPAVQKAFQKHAETNESSEEWAKSQEKIRNKRRDAMLKPGEKEKINKIRDMMKKANEGYESEISSHLKALDIDHHWKDGHLHVDKRDHKDVKKRLSDTDMEMPKIKVNEAKDDPCWDNYKQIGMKKKNGKKVPNCVPKESKYTLDDILTILGERYVAKTIANKRKASIRMKVGKVKHKAALGKRRAMRRMATQDVLKRRSRKQEWRNAFKKLAKGKKKSDMSIAQVRSIEKKLERPVWQRIVNRKSVIGVKDKRRLEIARKKGTWKK